MIRECSHELEKFPAIVSNMQELQRRKELKSQIERHKEEIEKMTRRFDVEYCRKWVKHVTESKESVSIFLLFECCISVVIGMLLQSTSWYNRIKQ